MDTTKRQKVFEILQKITHKDPNLLDPDSDIRKQVSLDSMQFVSIIAQIEEEFSIEIPISILEVSTLNEFLAVIDETFSLK
jgi:acyl carrier protein